MNSYKATGINLRAYALGDTDKIVVIYTRELGKIKVVAKGARRLTSKFGGRLEPFVCNELLVNKGRNLDYLSQAETVENFLELRQTPEKIETGMLFLKWAHLLTEEGYPDPEFYELLLSGLIKIRDNQDPGSVRSWFQKQLMLHEGVSMTNFAQFLEEYGSKA